MRFLSVMLAAAFTVLVLVTPTASAAYITYTGTSLACFGANCTPGSGVQTFEGLNYTPNSTGFTCTTDASGFCAIGASAPANGLGPGLPTGNNFGYFTLHDVTATYTGEPFTLELVFTVPTVTSSPPTFAATLTGAVAAGSTVGGVNVSYTNTIATLNAICSSPPGTGCFMTPNTPYPYNVPYTFRVQVSDNLNLTPPANNTPPTTTTNLGETGNIRDQVIPEPGTSMLLGSGLFLGAFLIRRLRRS